jgi:hypothetical protein
LFYNDHEFKMKGMLHIFLLVVALSASCSQRSMAAGSTSLELASFTENDVAVTVHLDGDQNRGFVLSATFVPPDGYHLYSKDIPITGQNGLGRPTLLELPKGSQITALGELIESAPAQVPDFEPRDLLVYPAGEVTLSLQIELPPGDTWIDDSVSITYMACSDHLCKPPVVGRIVPVSVPSADTPGKD